MLISVETLFLLLSMEILSASQVFSWSLQRATADESKVIVHNTTITGDQTYCTWMWMDSYRGLWDVDIRIWHSATPPAKLKSGSFTYHDTLGGGLLRVSWKRSPELTWKQNYATALPTSWWNLTDDSGQLDYQGGDSVRFHVDGESIRLSVPAAKPGPGAGSPGRPALAATPAMPVYGLLPIGLRAKREPTRMERQRKRFDLLDLFTGNGIFASLPQLFINIFSFFANLFPADNDDGDSGAVVEATEPEAEMVPRTTTVASTAAAGVVSQSNKPRGEQDMMAEEATKVAKESEAITEASRAMPKSSERLRN